MDAQTELADRIPGVQRIIPSYPIKPPKPVDKDRDSGRQAHDQPDNHAGDSDDAGDQPTIDEYV
jgi:hypothetical protein